VVESACVGLNDELKGEVPFALLVTKKHIFTDEQYEKVIKEVRRLVIKEIGSVAKLGGAIIVQKLPKTRSGKVLRLIIRKILNQEEFRLPSTIDDVSAIDELIETLKKRKYITKVAKF